MVSHIEKTINKIQKKINQKRKTQSDQVDMKIVILVAFVFLILKGIEILFSQPMSTSKPHILQISIIEGNQTYPFNGIPPGLYWITITPHEWFQKLEVEVVVCHEKQQKNLTWNFSVASSKVVQLVQVHQNNSNIIVKMNSSSFVGEFRFERKIEHYHTFQVSAKNTLVEANNNVAQETAVAQLEDISLQKISLQNKPTIHFFVFSHGNHGHATDFHYFGELLRKKMEEDGQEVFILYSSVNEGMKTHNGIDLCGQRLNDEIKAYYNNHLKKRVENENSSVLFSVYVPTMHCFHTLVLDILLVD